MRRSRHDPKTMLPVPHTDERADFWFHAECPVPDPEPPIPDPGSRVPNEWLRTWQVRNVLNHAAAR